MLGRWDKRLVDQVSDVPSIIISCKILCKKPFNLFFYNFTKIKIPSFECPKSNFQSIKIILGSSDSIRIRIRFSQMATTLDFDLGFWPWKPAFDECTESAAKLLNFLQIGVILFIVIWGSLKKENFKFEFRTNAKVHS